jgi:hypothetical protein
MNDDTNKRQYLRVTFWILAWLIILALILVFLDPFHLFITGREWESIKDGMTKAEVRKILGTPEINRLGEWVYYPINDIIYRYYVMFDDSGKVTWKYTLD